MWLFAAFCAFFYVIGWAIAQWIKFVIVLSVAFVRLCVFIIRKATNDDRR